MNPTGPLGCRVQRVNILPWVRSRNERKICTHPTVLLMQPPIAPQISSLLQLDVNNWVDKLGQGAFGVAYQVRSKQTGTPLCAKKIQLDSTTTFGLFHISILSLFALLAFFYFAW